MSRPPSQRQLLRTGVCVACGRDVALHYDDKNRMTGCAGAVSAEPVNRGRLIQRKLSRNLAAREDAKSSIREAANGQWEAMIGGRVRGRWVRRASRKLAEAAVDAHYNETAMAAVLDFNHRSDDGHIQR